MASPISTLPGATRDREDIRLDALSKVFVHLRDLANVNTNQMIICGGRIDGATTAAQASCDSCATPSCMGATEPRYGEIFAVRSNVRNWPRPPKSACLPSILPPGAMCRIPDFGQSWRLLPVLLRTRRRPRRQRQHFRVRDPLRSFDHLESGFHEPGDSGRSIYHGCRHTLHMTVLRSLSRLIP